MKRSRWNALIVGVSLVGCVGACGNDNPVKPVNRSPVILSLMAYPTAIGPGDSTIVICDATDPDADTLVYDWVTDSRLIIKGKDPADHELFNSPLNLHVFYHGPVTPFDSAWVECTVRDRKGGAAVRPVRILSINSVHLLDEEAHRRWL